MGGWDEDDFVPETSGMASASQYNWGNDVNNDDFFSSVVPPKKVLLNFALKEYGLSSRKWRIPSMYNVSKLFLRLNVDFISFNIFSFRYQKKKHTLTH